jgi:hypothetical protein
MPIVQAVEGQMATKVAETANKLHVYSSSSTRDTPASAIRRKSKQVTAKDFK